MLWLYVAIETTWQSGTTDSNNYWAFQNNNGWTFPISVKVFDSNGLLYLLFYFFSFFCNVRGNK